MDIAKLIAVLAVAAFCVAAIAGVVAASGSLRDVGIPALDEATRGLENGYGTATLQQWSSGWGLLQSLLPGLGTAVTAFALAAAGLVLAVFCFRLAATIAGS